MPSEYFKPESIFKQTPVNFFREKMTSFLNYVTVTLRAFLCDAAHFKMTTFFLKGHLGAIGKNLTLGVKWTVDMDARDIVDGMARMKKIISSVLFAS